MYIINVGLFEIVIILMMFNLILYLVDLSKKFVIMNLKKLNVK